MECSGHTNSGKQNPKGDCCIRYNDDFSGYYPFSLFSGDRNQLYLFALAEEAFYLKIETESVFRNVVSNKKVRVMNNIHKVLKSFRAISRVDFEF
jgi:hypothetical protein